MVPMSFETFFLATAGTGGAFIGLLFVAISILPQRTFRNVAFGGSQHQHLAEATLVTLGNGFVVSSIALIPGINLGWITLVLGATGVLTAFRLSQRLARLHQHATPGPVSWRHMLRVVSLSLVAMVMYAVQCRLGFQLLAHPTDVGPFRWLALLIVAFYALAIVGAWTLLGDPQHGLSGWLNPLQDLATTAGEASSPTSFVASALLARQKSQDGELLTGDCANLHQDTRGERETI